MLSTGRPVIFRCDRYALFAWIEVQFRRPEQKNGKKTTALPARSDAHPDDEKGPEHRSDPSQLHTYLRACVTPPHPQHPNQGWMASPGRLVLVAIRAVV